MTDYLAFDLGASNGRCVFARFDGQKLQLEEVHRFENGPVKVLDHLYWDALDLLSQIKTGILKTRQLFGKSAVSLGLDTWGCDFALLDAKGKLLSNPYCYRDPQTAGIIETAFENIGKMDVFLETGLQFIEPNSLFQLLAMQRREDPIMDAAATFLHIPDLLHYWLTGLKTSEYTAASTSQLMNAVTHQWSRPVINAYHLPDEIFPPIIKPGTSLGRIGKEIGMELDWPELCVTATATHDTAAAIAAVPAQGNNFAYISSGTWALLGQEISQPLLTAKCMHMNVANEGGVFGTITLLRNITNLWLLQECRRQWICDNEPLTWDEMVQCACAENPFQGFLDPDDPTFILPGNMPTRIQRYLADSKQLIPYSKGGIVRVILESLAFKYRYTLERVLLVTGIPVDMLYIIGGGSRNRILNQFCANATNLPVVAGSHEATIIGNVLLQMAATGEVKSLDEARELVRNSFPTEIYFPTDAQTWDDQYEKYLRQTGL
jgi:sugar (pentulose or hexulose) kinase